MRGLTIGLSRLDWLLEGLFEARFRRPSLVGPRLLLGPGTTVRSTGVVGLDGGATLMIT